MNGDFSRKSHNFPTPRVFNAPAERVSLGIGAWSQNLEWWGYRAEK